MTYRLLACDPDDPLAPTLADAADDRPRLELPDPYRCDDPWCPSRDRVRAMTTEHAATGCTACTAGEPCTYLELLAQEPHLHGTRPDGTRR